MIPTLLAALTLLSPAPAKQKPLLRDFIGLNTHTVQFKPDLYKPVAKLVRDYHPFDWDVGEETDFATRFPFARNMVNWEQIYGDWKKGGFTTNACVMFDPVLPPKWTNLEQDAWAYGYTFARFFGPSGRNKLVESVEIGNEPGKWDDAAYRKLFESAASGFRKGDPKLLIATCATYAKKSGDYHKNIDCVKGLEPLYDVINTHAYPELEPYPTWRRSFPEDPRLVWLKDTRDLIAWRDANAPGKQIWLTEFGYDSTTKPQEKEGTFSKWVGVTDTQQAQWLVRGFLTLSELDIDRAYIFWFNDEDKPTLHASSGLTRNYQPKPSFHAVAHLLATLGDYRLSKVEKKPGDLCQFEFSHATDAKKRVTVVWSPTGEGKSGKKTIKVGGRVEKAERMPMKAGPADAVTWQADKIGIIEIEVGESPVYVFWSPL